jgi:omega-amidase
MPPSVPLKAFTLALIQLGNIGSNKAENLRHAREMILRAAGGQGKSKRPDLIVLPECFNSPYGHSHFPNYAENIGFHPDKTYDVGTSASESVKMLSSAAKEACAWLIGGPSRMFYPSVNPFPHVSFLGSIPERDVENDKLYNTCTVYNPNGDLVAMHRKVHLFDIDIPGKIKFKESETLTGGTTLNSFDTGFARIGLGICYDIRFPEMAMFSARQGCHVLIYPGAFNLTTGPLHWELLQRSRAVDNQVFVSMCSPARDLSAGYHAWGHSMVVDPMGRILGEGGEGEEIIYSDIEPEVMKDTRGGIPVTVQRRFDVYTDVGKLPDLSSL